VRIVHVTNIVSPDKQGGLERYVRELAEVQAQSGHGVSIVAKAGPGVTVSRTLLASGAEIRRYFGPSKRNPLFVVVYPFKVTIGVLRILRKIGRSSETVYHAHHPVPAIALRLTRRPYFYTFHAPVYKEIIGERQATYRSSRLVLQAAVLAMKVLESWLLRGATRVHTLSDFVRTEASELGVHRDRSLVVPGGLDLQRFSASNAVVRSATPRVFAARRLVERTGVEELVTAFAIVVRSVPDAVMYVSGTGPRKEAIEALIERHGLSKSVRMLGWVTDAELVEQYRRATLTVTPTQYLEGFGLSTAESLACGTPAVVTPVGANAELVQALDPALLSADKSPEAMARTIVAVLQDDTALDAARSSLADGYASRWGWDRVSESLLRMYGDHRPTPRG
jgi:glycosyltransferase involved in cell wall biosynthesis